MCGVHLKDRRRSTDLVLMLCLNETMDQLTNSVRWHGHVLRREDGNVLIRALDFEVEDQTNIGRPKTTWKRQVEEVSLRREDSLCRTRWSVGVNQIAAGLR